MTDSTKIDLVVIREQLEDREIANFAPLPGAMRVRLVTSIGSGPYAASGLGLETVRLKRYSDLIPGTPVRRRVRDRLAPRFDLDRLRGFRDAVAGGTILCVNETHMVSSLQAVELRAKDPNLRIVNVCYENIPFAYEADPILQARRRRVRDGSDAFVAMSPGAVSALVAEGVDEARIHLIPYGVDLQRFDRAGDRDATRAELNLPLDAVVIMFTGRLLREKGLVNLALAYAAIPDRRAHLVLVGSGPERARIEAALDSHGCADRVRWVDWAPPTKIPSLLAAADVFALPSLPTPYWEEQLGFSAIEALASGLPVVGTDTGSIPFVVGDGGLVARPYDVGALRECLQQLVLDAELRNRLALAARSEAQSRFDVQGVAARLAELFRSVAEGNGRERRGHGAP